MKKNLVTAVLMTIATTILLGVAYPLVVTAIATVLFPANANGQLISVAGGPLDHESLARPSPAPATSTRASRPQEAATMLRAQAAQISTHEPEAD